MIRIVFENCDAGMAANVGGSVSRTVTTFVIDAPEIEAHLKKWSDTYSHTNIVGAEVVSAEEEGKP